MGITTTSCPPPSARKCHLQNLHSQRKKSNHQLQPPCFLLHHHHPLSSHLRHYYHYSQGNSRHVEQHHQKIDAQSHHRYLIFDVEWFFHLHFLRTPHVRSFESHARIYFFMSWLCFREENKKKMKTYLSERNSLWITLPNDFTRSTNCAICEDPSFTSVWWWWWWCFFFLFWFFK